MTDTQLKKQAYNRAYREKNREQLKAYDRARADQPDRQYSVRREYAKSWYQQNREHRATKMRLWYQRMKADPVRYAAWLERAARVAKQRPDLRRARERKWRLANPVNVRVHKKRDRARHANAQGQCLPHQWEARFNFYGQMCAYCGIKLTLSTTQADHVIAIKCGGSHWPSNLVPACSSCNGSKQTKRWTPRNFSLKTLS